MIYTINTIAPVADRLHSEHQTLVLVTGFFDRLHSEHQNFLRRAKAVGDVLLVAVESDDRARALKGEGRPFEPQALRLAHLAPFADYLLALDPSFNNPLAFESLIAAARPNILAVSSHTAHQDKKSTLLAKYGGQLQVVHSHNPAVSTTLLSTPPSSR